MILLKSKTGMNSKRKGKSGELELAAFLRERGITARRGQQYKGTGDSPDVIGLDGCHIECKRCEQGSLYAWLEKATAEAAPGSVPVVMHRRSRKNWVAILDLDQFLRILAG